MLPRWNSTVFGLRNSAAAASRLVIPRATVRATWSSCAVSDRKLPIVSRGGLLAGRDQLGPSLVGPRLGAASVEVVQRLVEGCPGVGTPAGAAASHAEGELGAGLLEAHLLAIVREGRLELLLVVIFVGEHAAAPCGAGVHPPQTRPTGLVLEHDQRALRSCYSAAPDLCLDTDLWPIG